MLSGWLPHSLMLQVATLIHRHLCNNEAAVVDARKHKSDFAAVVFPRVIPPGTPVVGGNPPGAPSIIPPPDTLPATALAPPPKHHAPRPCLQPAQPSQPSSLGSPHPPPFSTGSDSKRPRLPGKGTSSGSKPGYMAQFSDPRRLPVGYAPPPAERSARGPYQPDISKGKGKGKGTTKGKDKSSSDWDPLANLPSYSSVIDQGPPKGPNKGIPKGTHKGSAEGKSLGKGVLNP